MTILVLGLLSRGFPSVGSASGWLQSRTLLCSLSGAAGLCQAEGVTRRGLLP